MSACHPEPLKISLIAFWLLFFLSFPSRSAHAELKTGMAADVVMGQEDFTSSNAATTSSRFDLPRFIHTDGRRLFVPDDNNSRVLIFNKIPISNFPAADVVVGQPNFTSATATTTQNNFFFAWTAALDKRGRMYVADIDNNRIMIFNSVPQRNFENADIVLGQADFVSAGSATSQSRLNSPRDLCLSGDRLFVADRANRRILIWNDLPMQNLEPADVVLGQPNFTSSD